MISAAQWMQILVRAGVREQTADRWAAPFENRVQAEHFSYGARELPDFVGQTLYETMRLERLQEDLNYSAERIREIGNRSPVGSRWRSLIPRADELANRPEAFANAIYGGRLGNITVGDGVKYAGAGIPMITGRDNYAMLQRRTGKPVLDHPELLHEPDTALECAVSWWEARVKDDAIGSIERVTAAVQGGDEGIAERARYTELVRAAIS